MTVVLLVVLVLTNVRQELSLKAISILSTLKLAQIVVLVLMFVRLKQFTRQNNNNTQKKKSPISITKPGFFFFIYYFLFQFSQCFLDAADRLNNILVAGCITHADALRCTE